MIIPSPSENTSVLACEKRLERKIKWNAVRDAELLARSERVLGKSLSSSKVSEIDEVSSTCDDKPFNMGNGFMNTPVVRKKLRPPSTISAGGNPGLDVGNASFLTPPLEPTPLPTAVGASGFETPVIGFSTPLEVPIPVVHLNPTPIGIIDLTIDDDFVEAHLEPTIGNALQLAAYEGTTDTEVSGKRFITFSI
jgi:hypothetical protein